MKIGIVAGGSRGDVQPYIALGKGLKQAGYTVRILTTDDFETLATEAGLEFHSTGGSIEKMLQSDEWRKVTESGNFLTILSRMNAEMKKRAHEVAAIMPDLCKGMDIIVAGLSGMGGAFSIAEKYDIPVVQAHVLPITPTRAFASPLAPALSLGAPLNKLSFHIMRQLLWQSVRVSDMTTRKLLGMSKPAFLGSFKRTPLLYGYSRHVLPVPDDWDDLTHIAGYWFLQPPDGWTPPSKLVDFLNAGSPPVYIGFGSMGSKNPEEASQLAVKALSLSGQRGVIASGWGGLKQSNLPDSVYMLSSIPHNWLFPRMAAVVHHGGAGTTAAGLHAGVPSIIVPFMGDQPFWGRRIAALGVGPAPIPRKKLTPENLAEAIKQTVSDSPMRQRAAALGQKIRTENGVANAVALIKQFTETNAVL